MSSADGGQRCALTATDPGTLAIVTALIGVIAALACRIPARVAMRVDPDVALRAEYLVNASGSAGS